MNRYTRVLTGWCVLVCFGPVCYAGDAAGIHAAAASGNVEQIKVLLRDSPELVRSVDMFGRTPLHEALRNLRVAAAECLLDSGAGLETAGRRRDGGLHVVLAAGENSEEDRANRKSLVSLLLARGANVNAVNGHGKTPLHIAAMKGRVATLELLFDAGAAVGAKDRLGRTAMHDAAMYDQCDVIDWLISKKAEVNAPDDNGDTPLHVALLRYRSDATKRLLEHGAKVDAKNARGMTPLHIACTAGPDETEVDRLLAAAAEILLAHGADVNATDEQGTTALAYARDNDRRELLAVLRRHGGTE